MKFDLKLIVSDSLNMQRQLFNQGHENSGANIDVFAVVLEAGKKFPKSRAVANMVSEINAFESNHNALKYAKELDPRVVSMIKARIANLAA